MQFMFKKQCILKKNHIESIYVTHEQWRILN